MFFPLSKRYCERWAAAAALQTAHVSDTYQNFGDNSVAFSVRGVAEPFVQAILALAVLHSGRSLRRRVKHSEVLKAEIETSLVQVSAQTAVSRCALTLVGSSGAEPAACREENSRRCPHRRSASPLSSCVRRGVRGGPSAGGARGLLVASSRV